MLGTLGSSNPYTISAYVPVMNNPSEESSLEPWSHYSLLVFLAETLNYGAKIRHS